MFTGIVKELGTIAAIRRTRDVVRFSVHAPTTSARLALGESVAINGVCLSVVRLRQGALDVEMIPETRRLTTLGTLSVGTRVNVEPSLTLSDRLNGHLVLGHVDGVGRVIAASRKAGDVTLGIRVGTALRRYLVPKGPVAVDGVSLTLGARLSPTTVSVFLIPETIQRTTLGLRRVGDPVNIEVDYFAKLLAQLASRRL